MNVNQITWMADAGVSPAQAKAPVASHTTSADRLTALDVRAPRYTSYPTADRFTTVFGAAQYRDHLRARQGDSPLSLYLHIPFCESLCYYCGCNKVVTRHRRRVQPYLQRLARELDLVLNDLGGARQLSQLHWGGGTPTFLDNDEIRQLMAWLHQSFDFHPNGEYAIEVDPRSVDDEKIEVLAGAGFNRMSLGVQDNDPEVQQAINRIQPAVLVERTLASARRAGFQSTNFDLIYGLPKQNLVRFSATVEWVIGLRPDRIALYNYAHLPQRFRSQRLINDADLPEAAEKIDILHAATEQLQRAGYTYIGMDHFALPDDELSVAQRERRLHRNFQGYSTRPDCDLIALGASAISRMGRCYAQNHRSLNDYEQTIDSGLMPIARGLTVSDDDLLRRDVIMRLMCDGDLDTLAFGHEHQIAFGEYFAAELVALRRLVPLGLVTITDGQIVVSDFGRRNALRLVGACFDRYLQAGGDSGNFSRVL